MLCCEQATISHHLGILKNKGILVSQRVGKNTYYAIERNAFIDCILNSLIKKTIQIR
jgi:DNA-binding transcriptional ArsR family regulator